MSKLDECPYTQTGVAYNIGIGFIFVTSMSYQNMSGTFKFFKTAEEVDDYAHTVSLSMLPEWHSKNCPRCVASGKAGEALITIDESKGNK